MVQLKYLKKLADRCLKDELNPIEIYGVKSTLAMSLSLKEILSSHPESRHLFLFPDNDIISKFEQDLELCGIDSYLSWPSSEVSPYSSIFSSYRSMGKRSGFLASAVNKQHNIYLCDIKNLGEKLAPPSFFAENSITINVGSDLNFNIRAKLDSLGYRSVDTVEDPLSFCHRGELLDIFLPNYRFPVRIELFDTEVESIRFFDPENQRSTELVNSISIPPALEVLYDYSDLELGIKNWKSSCEQNGIDWNTKKPYVQNLTRRQYFDGLHYLSNYFHKSSHQLTDYFNSTTVWIFDAHEGLRKWDIAHQERKEGFSQADEADIAPPVDDLFFSPSIFGEINTRRIFLNPFRIEDEFGISDSSTFELSMNLSSSQFSVPQKDKKTDLSQLTNKIKSWRHQGFEVFCFFNNATQLERAKLSIVNAGIKYHQLKGPHECADSSKRQQTNLDLISICIGNLSEGAVFENDKIVLLNETDFFGKKTKSRKTKDSGSLQDRTNQLKFSDLKTDDLLVHIQHGVGKYVGMTTMELQGAETEFIQIEYRDKDKLYVPVYKIGLLQKYLGTHNVDRLGSKSWENSKIKVKKALKEIADELIRLYAKRNSISRPAYAPSNESYLQFEDEFPYSETEDQLTAIGAIMGDFRNTKPMDRLVCGDVGFGKTEVAMRAAFRALMENKQVALLVPTTVLAFQHFENFKKRFKNWPFEIRSLGRFTSKKEIKESLELLKIGKVDLVIGTHRLLSADVEFGKLGLLIIDEEHRFGVAHKEKLKQLKINIDCLALSATPIPRTLNMALMGVRDLSVINTAPLDRLPTRTYINRFNRGSIKKAITAELQRNGQIYFIHNRVQSIYARAQEIREIVPDARIEVAHGQMKDGELEKVMLRFFERKFDVLLCTTIVENGVDNPHANTMIIDNAHHFGLSQLYQLRGRVGRSKERAYCYLVIPQNVKLDPEAKERLKVIQENTALGSGFRIAHHDLELRGAGSFLGAEQSGHVNTVGYDLYLELLENTIKEAKGETIVEEIEPEINLRIPALIPDKYIPDIRVRLSYYKSLSEISGEEELEKIEDELVDQFGKLPDEIINLMGIMLIRKFCKDLGIKEVSSGKVNVSFAFTPQTQIDVSKLVELAIKDSKKFRLTPENKFLIRMEDITWPQVLESVKNLSKMKVKN